MDVIQPTPVHHLTAGALMSPATAREHDEVAAVARLFRDRRFRAAPVVDGEGRLIGMVSALDLLRALPGLAPSKSSF